MGPPPKVGVGKAQGSPGSPKKAGAPNSFFPSGADPHERFAQLTGSLPFIVWTLTPDGGIDYFNDAFVQYTGLESAALLGNGWVSTLHPDDVPAVAARWQASLRTISPYEIHFRIRRSDGEYRWHLIRAIPELDDDRRVLRWWGSAVDVHELRLLKTQAAELAADREAILESFTDGILTLDHEFRFTYLNHSAEVLLQRTRESLLGKVVWDEFPETRDSDLQEMYVRVSETGQAERMEDYAEPMKIWFDVSANPAADGLTVHLRDITQMKSLSDQLAIAHRLEAIGQLTGGIAHDFNNLLTVVMGAIESLSMEESLSPAGREMIDLVSQAANRGAELTHHLLAFARQQPLAPQAINVSQHVTALLPLLRRTLGDEIEIAADLARGLPPALVDPGQFESALLNLGINARDAMPEGGLLELETGITELDEEYAAAHGDVKPGRYILVSVGDTGTGIAPEHMNRLFDPFFTTKPIGQGSGLGLPMVWGFVKQSGGHLSVYSELGRGTTIRLYLPVAPQTSEVEEDEPIPVPATLRGTGHILLVEDDELVRRYATEQLSDHGYTVTAVGSGPETLETLKSLGKIDLLFTDVILPGGMTGRQLAVKVVALRPDTPVLYASGYMESVLMHDGRLDPDVSLLAKPYTSRQLLERIHQLLSAPSAGSACP